MLMMDRFKGSLNGDGDANDADKELEAKLDRELDEIIDDVTEEHTAENVVEVKVPKQTTKKSTSKSSSTRKGAGTKKTTTAAKKTTTTKKSTTAKSKKKADSKPSLLARAAVQPAKEDESEDSYVLSDEAQRLFDSMLGTPEFLDPTLRAQESARAEVEVEPEPELTEVTPAAAAAAMAVVASSLDAVPAQAEPRLSDTVAFEPPVAPSPMVEIPTPAPAPTPAIEIPDEPVFITEPADAPAYIPAATVAPEQLAAAAPSAEAPAIDFESMLGTPEPLEETPIEAGPAVDFDSMLGTPAPLSGAETPEDIDVSTLAKDEANLTLPPVTINVADIPPLEEDELAALANKVAADWDEADVMNFRRMFGKEGKPVDPEKQQRKRVVMWAVFGVICLAAIIVPAAFVLMRANNNITPVPNGTTSNSSTTSKTAPSTSTTSTSKATTSTTTPSEPVKESKEGTVTAASKIEQLEYWNYYRHGTNIFAPVQGERITNYSKINPDYYYVYYDSVYYASSAAKGISLTLKSMATAGDATAGTTGTTTSTTTGDTTSSGSSSTSSASSSSSTASSAARSITLAKVATTSTGTKIGTFVADQSKPYTVKAGEQIGTTKWVVLSMTATSAKLTDGSATTTLSLK